MSFWRNTSQWLTQSAYALPICFAILGMSGLAALHVSPEPNDNVFTIVFRPGMTFDEVADRLHKAGAELLTGGARDHIVVARVTNLDRKADLRAQGALLFLNANAATFCGPDTNQTESRAL